MSMTFLTGGARSGKSGLAVRMAAACGLPVTYIATGEPGDEEMAARIARHRAERPGHWQTIEAPRDVIGALETVDDGRFVILDCLTLWTANLFGQGGPAVLAAAASLASALAERPGPSAAVSNEVGAGIVPADPGARRYRDLLGMVNKIFRVRASESYLCVAGGVIPISEPRL